MSFIVAVDGYTGVGKGTLANLLAKKYKLMNIDTGAIYRCLTLDFIEKDIKDDDIELIKKELDEVDIKFEDGKSFLNGRDVSKEIREAQVNNRVSQVSHIPIVREAMTPGTPQPVPINIGIKLLPDNPNLRNTRSMTNAIRAI